MIWKIFRSSFCFFFLSLSGSLAAESSRELILYTYDSFVAQGGLGPEIFPLFEKKYRCKIRARVVGDSAQLLTQLQIDRQRGQLGGHVVVGLDQSTWDRAKVHVEDWGKWSPLGYSRIPSSLRMGKNFLPFDYGVFAFMVDREALRERGVEVPRNLLSLLKSEWKRNFILQDPRTSGPGLAFLLYSQRLFQKPTEFDQFWKKLKQQWLTVSPGWAQAYGLFLNQEAPLVWSYTTSQAYHREHGDSSVAPRYEAVFFDEGQPLQIEGAALIQGVGASPEILQLARQFLDFLISPEVQQRLPQKNWMFPVMKTTQLPVSFATLPHPKKLISIRSTPGESDEVISRWRTLVQ